MDIKELCDREETLTNHLKASCPEYIDAVRVVAYWVALAIEATPIPSYSWTQFERQVSTFRADIKKIMMRDN